MPATTRSALDAAIAALVRGTHRDPFAVLGPHDGVVRAFQPAARAMELRVVSTGALLPMTKRDPAGVFEVRLKPDTTEDAAAPMVRLKPDTTEDAVTDPATPVVSGFPPPPEVTARLAEGGSRTETVPDYR